MTPFQLADALHAIDSAESPAERVRAAVAAFGAFGFDRVLITTRDASLNIALSAAMEPSEPDGHALQPLPGATWRRRLVHLERYRSEELFLLDGSDPWVSREFFGADPAARSDPTAWLPTDLVLALLYGAQRELIGTVEIAAPRDGRRPSATMCRDLGSLARHLGARIAYDALHSLAQRRAERLQRLQEAGAALARSLDEPEIMRELCRQVMRATGADGVTIALPDLDNDILSTAIRSVRGVERPRQPVRLGDGIISEVARSGRPARYGDRDADRLREKAGLAPPMTTYDVVGDDTPASSVLAVPVLAGIHLIGVLAVFAWTREVFSSEDEELLATMASQAATAIANARRYAESERERRQTEALADVARAVGESLRLGEVLRLILRHAVALLGAEGACIALRQDDYLHIVAAVGTADVLAGVHVPVAGSLLGRAITTNELVVSNDVQNEPGASRAVLRLSPIRRAVIAPLMTGRGTIGAISVFNRDAAFLADDARVLQRLADHVAVAIVNARLFEEVERATREWKVAFDSIASGMVVLEENQSVRRCNARAAELCGVSIPQLLGQPFAHALLEGSPAAATTALTALIGRAMSAGTVTRHAVKDVVTGRLIELLAAPHPDGGCVLTFDDVTHAHQLAERHQRVLETVTDAIVITALDGRIAFANAGAHDLFGRGILIGLSSAELTATESLPEVQHRERRGREGRAQQYECQVLHASGTRRLVSVTSAPMFEVGKITGTVACLRDITEQRSAALELARTRDRYALLVESAMDGICAFDLDGIFTAANSGLQSAVGKTGAELIGTPSTAVLDPRDHAEVAVLLAAVRGGGQYRMQIHYLGGNGALRVGTLTATPILTDGEVTGGLGIVRDTTDEEILRESTAQHARLASVGQLLGGVANELNNPLASLLAVAELGVSSPTLAAPDREALRQIRDEARRASRIVAELLASTNERTKDGATLDLNRVVAASLELHGYSLRRRGIALVSTLATTPIAVRGDGGQLRQLLINVLTNAEDALDGWAGTREIHVTTRIAGGVALVDVADTGPGVAPTQTQRIFEPTFSSRAALGRRGYGLTISRAIAREHLGELDVTRALRGGAVFTLKLPVVVDAAVSAATRMQETPRTGASASVLLVENESTLRSAMARYLESAGYDVHMAAGGEEALTQLAARSFDAVLLDLRMDDLPGDDVYRALEQRDPAQAMRVLFITGDMHSASASAFVRATGRPVLPKPFRLADLAVRVAELVNGSAIPQP